MHTGLCTAFNMETYDDAVPVLIRESCKCLFLKHFSSKTWSNSDLKDKIKTLILFFIFIFNSLIEYKIPGKQHLPEF